MALIFTAEHKQRRQARAFQKGVEITKTASPRSDGFRYYDDWAGSSQASGVSGGGLPAPRAPLQALFPGDLGTFVGPTRLKPVETLIDPTDNDLIQATLAGNSQSFEALVRRYQERLLSAMTAVCGVVQEAEDVVQEAFLQAYCKLDGFRSESRFYTWLYRIAFNLSVNRRRRRRPHSSEERTIGPDGVDVVDPFPGPEAVIDQAERAEQLRAAIGRLPIEFRQVLVLRELEGFCYETISEVLGLPIGTVRSRLHRARQQLRDELLPWFSDD